MADTEVVAIAKVNKIQRKVDEAVRQGNRLAYDTEKGKQWRDADQRRVDALRREKRRLVRLTHRQERHLGT